MHHSERRARELLKRLGDLTAPVGVEVGVWQGEMSRHLLRLRKDMRLHMVDDWACRADRTVRHMERAMGRAVDATAFASDRRRIVRTTSRGAAGRTPDASLDFVFIDADHSYECVSADIEAWLPKVRPGGLLSGHDYSKPGERSSTGWPGVVRAVDEAVSEHGWTLERGNEATWFVRVP